VFREIVCALSLQVKGEIFRNINKIKGFVGHTISENLFYNADYLDIKNDFYRKYLDGFLCKT